MQLILTAHVLTRKSKAAITARTCVDWHLATAGVMAFSEVLSDISNHGKYSLFLYDMGRYMRLDAAAQRALNVMKTKFDANDNFSLYGLMSRARTSMGKRLLKASCSATCSSVQCCSYCCLNWYYS